LFFYGFAIWFSVDLIAIFAGLTAVFLLVYYLVFCCFSAGFSVLHCI